jgi:hypothetical protein
METLLDRVIKDALHTIGLPIEQRPLVVMPRRVPKPTPNAPPARDAADSPHMRVVFQGKEYDRSTMQLLLLHVRGGLSHAMGRSLYDIAQTNVPLPSDVDACRKQLD